MKKYLPTMLFVLVGCMTAMADSDIKVNEEDKKFLKTMEDNATLVFDWEDVTYDNKEPLAPISCNLIEPGDVTWNGFAKAYNEKCRNDKVVAEISLYSHEVSCNSNNETN